MKGLSCNGCNLPRPYSGFASVVVSAIAPDNVSNTSFTILRIHREAAIGTCRSC